MQSKASELLRPYVERAAELAKQSPIQGRISVHAECTRRQDGTFYGSWCVFANSEVVSIGKDDFLKTEREVFQKMGFDPIALGM